MQATATATGSAIWPSLVFIMGEERRSFVLQSPAFSIGRKADKDLTLLNPRVSRDHAMIVREGDGYFLQDQDSKHGTYVNGERVVKRQKLQPNDRIEFGVRGEGHLLFSPDAEASTSARDFLSRIGDRRPSQNISDLEMLTLYLEAARKLNTGGVLGDVLVTLIDALLRLTRSERGYVFLRNEDGSFRLAAGRDEKGQALTEDATISHSILNEAVASGSEFVHTDLGDLSKMAQRQSVVAQQPLHRDRRRFLRRGLDGEWLVRRSGRRLRQRRVGSAAGFYHSRHDVFLAHYPQRPLPGSARAESFSMRA